MSPPTINGTTTVIRSNNSTNSDYAVVNDTITLTVTFNEDVSLTSVADTYINFMIGSKDVSAVPLYDIIDVINH